MEEIWKQIQTMLDTATDYISECMDHRPADDPVLPRIEAVFVGLMGLQCGVETVIRRYSKGTSTQENER